MMIVGREICKVFPVQINHGYKLLMPPRHNLPHCPARCSKPDYFPDVMIGWPCFAAGGFSAISSSVTHSNVANHPF